jgi:hypothetical protein
MLLVRTRTEPKLVALLFITALLRKSQTRCKVFNATNLKITPVSDATACNVVEVFRTFGGTYYPCLQSRKVNRERMQED